MTPSDAIGPTSTHAAASIFNAANASTAASP